MGQSRLGHGFSVFVFGVTSSTIARNAPCPCGSGKRFKDCHGSARAAAPAPQSAESLLREAQVAFASGRAEQALALLHRATELDGARADLLRERARVEWTLGDPNAAATCRAAVARASDDVSAWNLLGEILSASAPTEAEAAWRRALDLDPRDAEALFHLGNRLREAGNHEAAIEHYERALERAPSHTGLLNNLGFALEAIGELERAEVCYRDVLAKEPQHALALANLANLLKARKRYHKAVLAYEQAIAVRRDFPARFWIARGVALGEIHAYAQAEASFREAARLDPDHAPTQIDIGSLCVVQEKFDAAEEPLSRALALDPSNPYAATMRLYARMQRCAWAGIDVAFAELARRIETDPPRRAYNAVPFPLLAMPLGPAIELRAARRWAQQIAAGVKPRSELSDNTVPARPPERRLRAGFVSADFREHPLARLIVECLEHIDRSRIDTFAYSLVPPEHSPFRERVTRAFEHFVDVSGEEVEAIAQRIAGDGIDVLIDLNGYTTHSRSELFALKPAPVQASWLGYLGTLGAPWYDYLITDRFAAPPELQRYFSERFLYLPDCYCPSDTRREVAARPPSRGDCALPERGFVFCCFNNAYKILPEVFSVWMRLLGQLPDSVLWLSPANATACANLRREAAARGVDAQRLIFAPRVSLPEHLARHVHADLFLDTTPYNAGTTANDALFMGLPLVTCAGATLASRVAGSQLMAIGLPELVTTTLADYEALALSLARDPARLAALRARLEGNRRSAALFDMARFARALDALLHAA
ncbi:MAG TPA: tetratricopeptide repeat protein, partial [Myxococcales bacterium]|nr:tetratricopeptide repeat protein [Myxococcales bacterium]